MGKEENPYDEFRCPECGSKRLRKELVETRDGVLLCGSWGSGYRCDGVVRSITDREVNDLIFAPSLLDDFGEE